MPHREEKQIHGDIQDLAPNSKKRQWKESSCKMHEIKITLDSSKLALGKHFYEANHHIWDTLVFVVNKH